MRTVEGTISPLARPMLLALAAASLACGQALAQPSAGAGHSPEQVLQSLNTEFSHWAYPQVGAAMVHALRCDRAQVAGELERRLKVAFGRLSLETAFAEAKLRGELARRGVPQALRQPCRPADMEKRLAIANRTLDRIEGLVGRWERLQQPRPPHIATRQGPAAPGG